MFENKGRTELNQLGEFGLIDHLTKDIELQNKSHTQQRQRKA